MSEMSDPKVKVKFTMSPNISLIASLVPQLHSNRANINFCLPRRPFEAVVSNFENFMFKGECSM